MREENKIESYLLQNELDMNRIVEDYYNYVSKIIKNNNILGIEDAEEIISDVFLIVWKNKNRLDKKLKFSPYIAGITKKVIYRKYKELSKAEVTTQYDLEIVDKFNIDKIIQQKEINECITKNLKKIGQVDYEIFTKFYYEGKKIKQIAKELNLSPTNVKTKLHRTREKVKQILRVGGFENE